MLFDGLPKIHTVFVFLDLGLSHGEAEQFKKAGEEH
jgi:hypothetical protein